MVVRRALGECLLGLDAVSTRREGPETAVGLHSHSHRWENPRVGIFITIEARTQVDFYRGRVCLELFDQGKSSMRCLVGEVGESRHCTSMVLDLCRAEDDCRRLLLGQDEKTLLQEYQLAELCRSNANKYTDAPLGLGVSVLLAEPMWHGGVCWSCYATVWVRRRFRHRSAVSGPGVSLVAPKTLDFRTRELIVDGKECICGLARAKAEVWQLLGRGQPMRPTPRPAGAERTPRRWLLRIGSSAGAQTTAWAYIS